MGLLLTPHDVRGQRQDKNEISVQDTPGVQSEEFVYRPMGRRDPFKDPLLGQRAPVKRKPGLAGIAIDELTLEGIVYARGKFIALVKSSNVSTSVPSKSNITALYFI